jgi:hypothetical protein
VIEPPPVLVLDVVVAGVLAAGVLAAGVLLVDFELLPQAASVAAVASARRPVSADLVCFLMLLLLWDLRPLRIRDR